MLRPPPRSTRTDTLLPYTTRSRSHNEEGATAYNTDRGVEGYERLKGAGPSEPAVWNPLSTGITHALIERATADKAPIISMGYGRADASDGRVFTYVFTLPTTYWHGADPMILDV